MSARAATAQIDQIGFRCGLWSCTGSATPNGGFELMTNRSCEGALRLLERVEADGLVTRGSGPDRRPRSVRLTAGARRIADQRVAYLDAVLDGMTTAERRTMHGLLARLMSQLVTLKDGGR